MFSILNSKSFPSVWEEFMDDYSRDKGERTPAVDIYEFDGKYYIEALLPGFKKEEVNINLDGDILTVSAERKPEDGEKEPNYLRKEIRRCSYKRNFSLSEEIDRENIGAQFDDGILKLELNKTKKPEKEVKQIKIS